MNKKLLGGRYELGEMIGTGGMADVYIAEDKRLSRQVAVKILRSDLARDPSFIARFKKEALAAAGLNHPGIVSVFDSGEEQGESANTSYIVMEYVKGHTLRAILHNGDRLSFDRAIEITEGILAALDYSHQHGIIHRDIKPGNIMLTKSGAVKVMDFGIARALDDVGATMTSTWNVVGTAQYLSPEQAIGDQADSRSDLYSVGCLFYELISGKPPFTGDTPVAIAYQHVSGVVTPATQLQPTLNSMVDNFISVALAKSPDDRYQSAIAMLDDLKRLARGEAITREIPRIKKPTKRLKMAALLSVVLLGLGVVANFTIFSKTDSKLSAGLPNVVGLTETQARELLVGFTITINRARDPRIPIDRVVSQLPLATSKVSSGSSVTLTLSDGPGDATVPVGLIGISLEEARILLVQSGLVILRTNPVDSEQVPGTVLVVTPQSGETVRAGSGVVLDIASGNVQVPTLIGVSEIQARTLLIQAGFLVKIVDAIDATQPVGIVLAQAPDGGSVKTIGSSVTITINRAANN